MLHTGCHLNSETYEIEWITKNLCRVHPFEPLGTPDQHITGKTAIWVLHSEYDICRIKSRWSEMVVSEPLSECSVGRFKQITVILTRLGFANIRLLQPLVNMITDHVYLPFSAKWPGTLCGVMLWILLNLANIQPPKRLRQTSLTHLLLCEACLNQRLCDEANIP
jgi:hypothetical protein